MNLQKGAERPFEKAELWTGVGMPPSVGKFRAMLRMLLAKFRAVSMQTYNVVHMSFSDRIDKNLVSGARYITPDQV